MNVRHLSSLIENGTLDYAIGKGDTLRVFSNEVDLGLLVLSIGKCMFPVRFFFVYCVNHRVHSYLFRLNAVSQLMLQVKGV